MKPSGHTSVMASRTEAPDSLDLFPTPPWATRAFLPILQALDPDFSNAIVWEPACGLGHMATVLGEAAGQVVASDVFDYSRSDPDFISGPGPGWVGTLDIMDERVEAWPVADWAITNPPFRTALIFAERLLPWARRGVALLVRTAWLEGGDRFNRLFSHRPPRLITQYAERVPMTKGRWDPEASTATAYCWVVWTSSDLNTGEPTQFRWIPPGQRKRLSTVADVERFGVRRASPLLDKAAL